MRAALAVACAAPLACGKKGPPLAPIIHVPAAVERIDARRRGDDVLITLTVPAKNIDESKPADIGRVEVYGYTGLTAPAKSRFLDVATLVGTITVQPPPEPGSPPPPPDETLKPGEALQGGMATLREALSAEALVAKPIPLPPSTGRTPARPSLPAVDGAGDVEPGPIRRFYLALPFSPRGRPGPPGAVAELLLTLLPDPPQHVMATVTADAVTLAWQPSGGLLGFILERPLSKEPSPLDDLALVEAAAKSSGGGLPDGPSRYNVYRHIAPAPSLEGSVPPEPQPVVPVPINVAPLDALTFSDPLPLLDGRERCYTIATVRGSAQQAVEGDVSSRVCVTPMDDFPPAPPAGLSTISAEGAITLIWEPSSEPDLAGYLVLRGEAGDATLTPLTDVVVTEARFTDRTVRPGVRYVYAVQAIDTRLPRPNVSAESARVEDTAR